MELMIAGLVLWSVVHFVPSIGMDFKTQWVERLGEKGYSITFSVLIVLSLIFIIFGWRSTTPSYIYALPEFVRPVSAMLLLLAFFLFGAANHPTRIKRVVRHPQMACVIVWSIAHLLLNGDSRSVVLFSWLGIWAVLEIIFINRREGDWEKETAPSWGQELKGAIISLAIFAVAVAAHPYIAGVPIK